MVHQVEGVGYTCSPPIFSYQSATFLPLRCMRCFVLLRQSPEQHLSTMVLSIWNCPSQPLNPNPSFPLNYRATIKTTKYLVSLYKVVGNYLPDISIRFNPRFGARKVCLVRKQFQRGRSHVFGTKRQGRVRYYTHQILPSQPRMNYRQGWLQAPGTVTEKSLSTGYALAKPRKLSSDSEKTTHEPQKPTRKTPKEG